MKFGNVLIFGDSYSTFKGYIPEGYISYYPTTLKERPMIDKVCDTWWHALISETNSTLLLNNSWSGSTIGYTGYSGSDTSKTSSFITRLEKLEKEGFFKENKIDTVFVFGATNDSWSDAPLGNIKYENIERCDLYSVLPAISFFLGKLSSLVPNSRIVFIINTELKDTLTDAIKTICEHFSIEAVTLSDIDKKSDHPTVLGMKQIKEQVIKSLT